jgi:hypothetical protein
MQGARLLGFVDAHLPGENTLSSAEQRLEHQTLEALREALGADAAADLMAEGALMTQDQALATAAKIPSSP